MMSTNLNTGLESESTNLRGGGEVDVERRFVKPRDGALVRDPGTKAVLPLEGFTVPWIGPEGRYWRRRAACGDVTVMDSPPPAERKKEEMRND